MQPELYFSKSFSVYAPYQVLTGESDRLEACVFEIYESLAPSLYSPNQQRSTQSRKFFHRSSVVPS